MNIAPLPSIPSWTPPPGSANCHAHIMGPFDKFPVKAGSNPPFAPVEAFIEGLDRLGLQYGVIVHSSSYGTDTRILLDALKRYPGRLRGVGLADMDTTDAELEAMAAAGVRGIRFTGVTYPAGRAGHIDRAHSVGIDNLFAMAPRLKALGLHAQLWMHCDQLMELSPRLLKLGIPLVLDHMGRFDPASGLDHPGFRNLVDLLKTGHVWIKLIPQRNSEQRPAYAEVRPFQAAMVAANPDRLVWGSDWPHTNTTPETMPDGGRLLNLLAEWVPDAGVRKKILADNAAALYRF